MHDGHLWYVAAVGDDKDPDYVGVDMIRYLGRKRERWVFKRSSEVDHRGSSAVRFAS